MPGRNIHFARRLSQKKVTPYPDVLVAAKRAEWILPNSITLHNTGENYLINGQGKTPVGSFLLWEMFRQ